MLDRLGAHYLTTEAAFVGAYDLIRPVCSAPNAPGVAIFAIDGGGVQRAALLPARPDGLQAAIVGSHPDVDLSLRGDDIASRHIAIITHPTGDDRLWFRLIDLRSESGMYDEEGERVAHCVCDGPVVTRIGNFYLFVIPLRDNRLRWPDDAHEAWRSLPPRSFSRLSRPERRQGATPIPISARGETPRGLDPRATLVQDIPGPRFARSVQRVLPIDLPDPASASVGELLIANSAGASASIPVDAASLRAGLLLGRDERCDEPSLLDDPRISRVHMLILEVEGRIYTVDTASANGVWRKGEDACGVPLVAGQRLTIARGLAWLKWMPRQG